MSLFPRSSLFTPEASFTPLFRLLDDFDSYQNQVAPTRDGINRRRGQLPTFSPRFDVKETEANYELHGEIPGAEKDNISIEFTEPQTIVISGRTERSYTSGTPPTGFIEGNNSSTSAITDGKDASSSSSHKATVEDEDAEKTKEKGTEVAKADQQQQQKPKERLWVSERSVGEFSRTFSFPTPVDQEAVSANFKDGVLSVTVPKAHKKGGKRIAVN